MLPSRLPRLVRIALYGLATAVLLYLCLAPSGNAHQPYLKPSAGPLGVSLWDEAQHAVAWLVLTAGGLALAPRRPWAIAAYAFGFGVLVEAAQDALGFGRNAELFDLVADMTGAAVAFAGYFVALALRRRGPLDRRART
jgi:VanZ family protein